MMALPSPMTDVIQWIMRKKEKGTLAWFTINRLLQLSLPIRVPTTASPLLLPVERESSSQY